MNELKPRPAPQTIDETLDLLTGADYVADRSLATVLFLSLRMKRPLFLEGEAGVGKTEIAKVLAQSLGRRLIRLQCYEGLDVSSAVYEWNYAAQMIEIRMEEAAGKVDRKDMERNVFSEKYLIRRPVLDALTGKAGAAPVFLIDELDRTDEAFEAFLLEILSDYQVTVPELGTIKAEEPPIVIITTNRTREIHDALKRRCLYHWVDYPDAERELEIVRRKVPQANQRLSAEVVRFIQKLREIELFKVPGVAETIDWAERADRTRQGGARPRNRLGHDRRSPEVPGRHRAHRAGRRPPHPQRGQGRAFRRGGVERMNAFASHPNAANPDGRIADNIVYFARALRKAGMRVGPASVKDAIEAVLAAGIGSRDDFYWTLHAVLVSRHEDHATFDEAFRLYWKSRELIEKMLAMFSPVAPDKQERQKPRAAENRVSEAMFEGHHKNQPPQEIPEIEIDARFTVSGNEMLRGKDFAQMSAAEISDAKRAIADLRLPFDTVTTRRFKADPRGRRIDPRAMMRLASRTGGELILPKFRSAREVHPPLVVLADISGSMSQYTRIFLHFLHALTEKRRRVHTFVFGTRLTNLTRQMRHRDPDDALADCFGGGQGLVRRHPDRRHAA